MDPNFLQAIANTAGFHFATIEQGGNSLYPSLAQRATDVEVLRILMSIGPTETMHFQTWSDKAGNAPPLTNVIDPVTGVSVTFPNLDVSNPTPEKEPDHARAMSVPESKPPHCFDHSTNEHGRCRHGGSRVSYRDGTIHWPIACVLCLYEATRSRRRLRDA